jgi:hypothetical protein
LLNPFRNPYSPTINLADCGKAPQKTFRRLHFIIKIVF